MIEIESSGFAFVGFLVVLEMMALVGVMAVGEVHDGHMDYDCNRDHGSHIE